MTPDLRIRPTSVMSPSITLLCQLMRDAGRDELLHYAGASYRDDVAWALCGAWLDVPTATESELKAIAMNATSWGPITAADLRAANPGMA
jgi:hypothetical protein